MDLILVTEMKSSDDRRSQLQAFEDSKAGVKGLADAGVTKIPHMFNRGKVNSGSEVSARQDFQHNAPIIDLEGIHSNPTSRNEVIEKVRDACGRWGVFQVINHEIPRDVLNGILHGVHLFHNQETEIKKEYYSRDPSKKVVYYGSNFYLDQVPVADWRDTVVCRMAPHPPKPEQLPQIFRDIVIQYTEQITNLANTLFEILSEALGLNPSHLKEMGCARGLVLAGHYYPGCPEPEYAMFTRNHTDFGFLTILVQDNKGGLQVHHKDQWVDVPPVDDALVVNMGDLLQLVSNDRFKSVSHRVLANHVGPRISVACFIGYQDFTSEGPSKVFGPIQELVSAESPAVYRETSLKDFFVHYSLKEPETPSLQHLKLSNGSNQNKQ